VPDLAAAPRFFADAAAFGHWLAEHATSATELVVGFHKVGSGRPSMSWPESVDEALCVGWIDGVRKRIDDVSYQIRFTPRKPGSIWSAINIAKVEALSAAGRMRPAGLAAFALRSEARSVIYAYEQAQTATLTAAEERLFKRDKAAWAYWQSTPPGYQKQMLHRITTAKKAETRAARLKKLMDLSAQGQRWL
jgi:uncharacterized protein YdeI (YjbR/CyaY-like superfamily)